MRTRTLTDQERAQRRERDLQLVRESVERLRSSEGWRKWLATRARFRAYSWRNQLLIASQHPTATRVAGFRAWLGLGYAVQAGSKAIRIWAPCPPSKRALERWEQQGADPASKPRTGWRLACVFAQDQVAPLPPPAVPAPLEPPIAPITGNSHRHLLARLDNLAGELGYTVQIEDSPRGDGYCDRRARRIVIDQRLSPNAAVATRIHELAHALVDADRHEQDPSLGYAEEELVAESVAYTCCRSVDLATDANSIPYLASWAERAELELLEHTARLIHRLVSRIEDALHNEHAGEPHDEKANDRVDASPGVSG